MSLVRFVVVDVRNPAANTLDQGNVGIQHIPGDVVNFGFSEDNTMHGYWRVISLERVGHGSDAYVRCNVER